MLVAVTAVGNRALPRYEPALDGSLAARVRVAGPVVSTCCVLAVTEIVKPLARACCAAVPAAPAPCRDALAATGPAATGPAAASRSPLIAGFAVTAALARGRRRHRRYGMAGRSATEPPSAGYPARPAGPHRAGQAPRRADGYRIAVVSDIHLGPLLGRAHTAADRRHDQRARRRTSSRSSATWSTARVAELGAGGGAAGASCERGTAASSSPATTSTSPAPSTWIDDVRELGLHPLDERAHRTRRARPRRGQRRHRRASDGDAPDYAKALGDRDPARPVVLLAHQPVQVHEAVEARRRPAAVRAHPRRAAVAVQLCDRDVPAGDLGTRWVDGMPVYVTNGAGFWGPPVRVGAAPDVTLVELRTGEVARTWTGGRITYHGGVMLGYRRFTVAPGGAGGRLR